MCISRRAHADRTSFKLYKEEGGTLKDGKYIWTEFRCPNVVTEGKKTCIECTVKLPKHKYQANPKCDHGLVGGPYPSDSKLYGSPFYLKEIKEGWKIHEADELRAKEAQQKASSEMPRKKTDGNEVTMPAIAEPVKPKQPRKIRVKKNETVVAEPVAQVVAEKLETGPAKFVESMAAPIKISDVIVVKVKKIRVEGKDYYFDSESGKVYGVSTTGVGAYKGRYNAETEALNTSYPDSDAE
jgi:hypothetical protein